MFKKTKKELSVEEQLNVKLNKERLAKAGFGYYPEIGAWVMVINKVTLIPDLILNKNWNEVKKEIIREAGSGNDGNVEAVKGRLEI